MELGGSEVYFLSSLRLDLREARDVGRKPGEMGELDPSCVWKALRLLARAKSLRKHLFELLLL